MAKKKDLYKIEGLEHTYTDGEKVYGMVNPDKERFNIIDENTPDTNTSHTVEINGRTYSYISNETGDKLIKNAVALDKEAGIRNAGNVTKDEIEKIVDEIMTGKNIDTGAKSGVNEKVEKKVTTRRNMNVFIISPDEFDLSKPVGKFTFKDKKKINELHGVWKSKQSKQGRDS